MAKISTFAKAVATHTAATLDIEKPPIYRHTDDNNQSELYVLEAADRPQKGVTSYATVGLSEYPLIRNGKEFNVRVEILGACGSTYKGFEKIIATLGFCVINSKWFCAPGVIFPDVVEMYELSATMSDIYFSHPFLWDESFKSKNIEGVTTAWLLAVPVSKKETEFAREHGPEKLEELFSMKDIDIFDLNRLSVI